MPLPPLFPAPVVCQVQPAEIVELAQTAVLAYESRQEARFHQSTLEAWRGISCLKVPLSAAQAAAFHQMVGLHSVLSKDNDGAQAAFRAAIRSDPSIGFSPRLLESELIRTVVAEARAAPLEARRPLVAPSGTRVLIDGTEAADRPTTRPFLLQVVWTADGAVHWSGYVPAGSYELNLDSLAPPKPSPLTGQTCPEPPTCPAVEAPKVRHQGPPAWLGLAAMGATAATLVPYRFYSQGSMEHTAALFDDAPQDEISALARQRAAWGYATLGVGVAAVGLDVGYVVSLLRHRGEVE